MLKSYEAIYDREHLKWLGDVPAIETARVIVTVLIDMMSDQFLGDISPIQAWQDLQNEASAVLVDVRTRAEWTFVGGPDLSSLGKSVAQTEWLVFPRPERIGPESV